MTQVKKLERGSLRDLGVPKALTEEALEIASLDLAAPMPTDHLVRTTLERCRQVIQALEPAESTAAAMALPAMAFGELCSGTSAQFLGALHACVYSEAVPFARAHPDQPAFLVVDNHSVFDPEKWESDPFLQMIHRTYQGAEDVLGGKNARGLDRLIILKEDLEYDDKDLDVIRAAMKHPTMRSTYLLAASAAGPFKERGCAVVGKQVVFEIEKSGDGFVIKEAVRDPVRAEQMCHAAVDLKRHAFPVYVNNELNPKLDTALSARSNRALLSVFETIVRD